MYHEFFGLAKAPFDLTPDTSFLFLSNAHKGALAHLHYGVSTRKGFISITGDIGVGKTTICRQFLRDLRSDPEFSRFRSALVLNPILTGKELLSTILHDLGVAPSGRTVDSLLNALADFVTKGNETVILIDEAQDLTPKVMEQLRLLGNLETETRKLVQLVLVGQPELGNLLCHPRLSQLNQRIAVRFHVSGLSLDETGHYIDHRLRVAGNEVVFFSPDAVEKVHMVSNGIPRVINILCEYTLLAAFAKDTFEISGDLVDAAYRQYRGGQTQGRLGDEVPAESVATWTSLITAAPSHR
jgi:general secretion pathway protein A